MPDGHVVGVQVIFADRAHHYLSSVDTNPQVQGHPTLASPLLGVSPHLLLHAQGGIESTLGMIFVGDWRAKQSKDAITERLCHVALVAMHGLHHDLQGGINDAAGVFRVEVFDESGGAFEVNEEGSDGLAFAIRRTPRFHRRPLSKNALSEMSRRIGNRSRVRSPK